MKYLLFIIAALLLLLIGFIFGQRSVPPCPEVVTGTTRTADTTYLQAKVEKKPYKPVPGKVIPAAQKPADSIETPAAYIYQDSLVDSNLAIYITDTTAGEILGRGISYTLKVPLQIKETITITKEVDKPVLQRGLFIGAEIGGNLQMYRIAPEIEYLTRSGYAYSYNYDLINSIHSVGIKRRIKF